jgi:hypothetical protein
VDSQALLALSDARHTGSPKENIVCAQKPRVILCHPRLSRLVSAGAVSTNQQQSVVIVAGVFRLKSKSCKK